jgi:GDP-4-dehydro-6-deoxy-D-mannose reductase
MRVLLTGVTGFVGGHLVDALRTRAGVELIGIARAEPTEPISGLTFRRADLCDCPALEAILRDIQPQQIFHLSGYAHAGRSNREPDATWAGNLTATRTLYDAIQRWGGRPRILYVGSAMVYGDAPADGAPFTEEAPLRPTTPYASSKAAADLLSYQYTRTASLDIVRARPFNHIGPGQSPDYAVANFARQIAALEQGRQPPILETGNLSAARDLTDVRDVVQAYLLLMERGRSGEIYNVASGETRTMKEVLDCLLAQTSARIEVRTQERLLRSTDTARLCGDAGKLHRETGWMPRFRLEQTLIDTLEYWRSQNT